MFNLAKIKPRFCRFLPSWRFWLKSWWGKPALVLVLVVGAVGMLSLASPAKADIAEYLYPALAYILEAIAGLIGKILMWVIHYIIVLSGYNNFLNAPVVSIGWSLTRDVANMFYILVMLIIAFGTMFNLEQYSWKKLLPRLILTAILVNFSKTIIGLFIDFAQVIMLTFVNGYAAAAGGNFVTMFQLDKMFGVSKQGGLGLPSMPFEVLLAYFLGTVLMGVALVVTAVFAAILLCRIITLWILIVLAPLAFMLGTFPKGQEYYADWWKRLVNQIIVGPVIAFFLWLSLATMGGGNQYSQLTENNAVPKEILESKSEETVGQAVGGSGELAEIAKWENLGSFAVSIAMLFLALQMTQQLGVAGAGLASGAAGWMKQQGVKWAKRAAVPVALGLGVPIAPVLRLGAMYGAYKGAGYGTKFAAKTYWARKKLELKDRALKGEGIWKVMGKPSRMIEKAEAKKEYAEEELKRVTMPLRGRLKTEVEAKRQGGYAFDYEQAAEAQLDSERRKAFAHINSADKFSTEFAKIEAALPKTTGKAKEELLKKYGQVIRMSQDKGYFEDSIRSLALEDQKNNTYQGRYRELKDKSNIAEGQVKFIRQAIFGKKDNEDISDAEMGKHGSFLRSLAELDTDGDLLYRHLTTVDDKGNYKLRGAKASELPDEIEKVEKARDFAYSKMDKAEQARVRPLFTHMISGDNNVIQADYRGRETARFTGMTERNAGSLPIRDGNWLIYGKEMSTDSKVQKLKEMNRKDNILHLTTEDLTRIAPHLLDKNQVEGIAKLIKDMGGAADVKNGTFPIQIVEEEKDAAGNVVRDKDGNVNYKEIGVGINTRGQIASLLPSAALVNDKIISSGTMSEAGGSVAINELISGLGNLTSNLTQVGQTFEDFIQKLAEGSEGLKAAAEKIGKKETDSRKKDSIFSNLQHQLVQPDAEIRRLIYQLWLNTQQLKKREQEEEEKKKAKIDEGAEAPPAGETRT